jgi:peptidoglycan/xylan/chitin deacetylase (PgdA/CDA1 family)
MLVLSGCLAQPRVISQSPVAVTITPFQPAMNTAAPTTFLATTATTFLIPANTPPPPALTPTTELTVQEPTNDSPSRDPTPAPPSNTTITVPILLYHHISDTLDSQYNVHPDRFAEQMKWLYDRGYSTVTVADVARAINEGAELPPRPVVLTFDDGYLDVYKNAYPILQQYGFVATFYIIAETVDTAGNLNTKKLQKLLAGGWEIGSHSMTHADLTAESDWENEILNAKMVLEDKLATNIFTFAYPFGKANLELRAYTLNAGYTAAVGLGSIMEHNAGTLFFLHRKEIKSWYGLDFFDEFMPWKDY